MIFSKPIAELNIEDIKTFCEKGIREGFALDYKADFPHDLAKSICAFANTFGGVILIGVEEDNESKPKLPVKGILFERGLHERVMSIILDNINPPLFPEINVIKFEKENKELAVIVVGIPQSDETPHTINNRRFVYVRTDNRNKPEEVATIEQIEWLLNKRKKSEELKKSLYNDADERLVDIYRSIKHIGTGEGATILPKGLSLPKAQGIFSAIPLFPNKPFINVRELKNLCNGDDLRIRDYFGGLNYFPYFDQEVKTTQQSVISYFLNETRKQILFYEFNIYGLFFYQEPFGWCMNEKGQRERSGKINSVWFHHVLARLDQFLEIIERFYDKIGVLGLIEVKLKLNNIFGLKMVRADTFFSFPHDERISNQRNLEIRRILTKQQLKETRVDILKEIFKEVCLTFNFDVGDKIIEDYLRENKRLF